MSKEPPKPRKSKARQRDIVFGAIDERLQMLAEYQDPPGVKGHAERVIELIDELRRSLNGKESEE